MTPREKIHFAIDHAAKRFHMTGAQLLDEKGQCEPIRSVRHMAFLVASRAVKVPPIRMAKELKRDRTTVQSNVGAGRDRLGRSRWWREQVDELVHEIEQVFGSENIVFLGLAPRSETAQKERLSETA